MRRVRFGARRRGGSLSEADETGEAIDARARVVAWARAELGVQDPNKYYRIAAPQFADRGHEHDVSWCGVFCLAALRECGLTDMEWVTGKGFVYKLALTDAPEPGDIAVFGPPLWHHAIVERLEGGLLHTIDGNTMTRPIEGVTARKRALSPQIDFYSLGRLISQS